jgi:hypothetical protein
VGYSVGMKETNDNIACHTEYSQINRTLVAVTWRFEDHAVAWIAGRIHHVLLFPYTVMERDNRSLL